jgi:peptidyl-prolyl cis-trans isomerase B (cyclophilin B)
VPNNQQRRDAAKRHLQRQNKRRAQQAKAAHQRLMVVGVVAAVLVIAGAVWLISSVATGSNTASGDTAPSAGGTAPASGDQPATGQASSGQASHGKQAALSASGPASDKAAGAAAARDASAAPSDTASTTGSVGDTLCSYPAIGTAAKKVNPPTDLNPPHTGTTEADVTLNSGDLTFQLDRAGAPCAVNSFVSLAKQHYFDDTPCHRLTTSAALKVLQCGDPSGTGSGGPGYSFADELTGHETYTAGTLAMANAGPDTNGSQFFIVYGDSQLPPKYTVLGKVTNGMNVVKAIAAKGVDGGGSDGAPAEQVTIKKVTVRS